jgi:hypothetical protein
MFFHFPHSVRKIMTAVALALGITVGLLAVTELPGVAWHPVETLQASVCVVKTDSKVVEVTVSSSETGSNAGIQISDISFTPKPETWVAKASSSAAFPDSIVVSAVYPASLEGVVGMKYVASFPQDNPVSDGVSWKLPVGSCRTPAVLNATAEFTCVAVSITVSNTGETDGTVTIFTLPPNTGRRTIGTVATIPAGTSITKVIGNPLGTIQVTSGSTMLLDREFSNQVKDCNPPAPKLEIITSVVETKAAPPIEVFKAKTD